MAASCLAGIMTMPKLLNSFFHAFLLIASIATAQAAETPTTNTSVHTYTLANGLQLLVKEDHRSPVIMSEVWYKVGSSNESDGYTGLSHMLEHMMFQGTPKYGKGVLLNVMDENGGDINAMTTADYTMYYEKLSSDKLPLSFDLESDRMRHLTLNQKDFDKEKQVVINERKMRTDNDPQATTFERLNAAGLLGNPYSHPVVGWLSDLNNMKLEDLRNWYTTWYAPNNAIVVVVGDVDPQKVYQLAQQYFGPLKPQVLPTIKPHAMIKPLGPVHVQVDMPANLPYLLIGYNVPSHPSNPTSWEPYALEVLSAVLDEDRSSRLEKELVRSSEIATSADDNYSLYDRFPDLFIFAGIPAQGHNIEQLKTAFFEQVKRLQDTPIPDAELARVKTALIARQTYERDSISTQAYNLGKLVVVNLPWQEFDNYFNEIEKITPQQVQAVAKKYLVEDRCITAVLNPLSISTDKPSMREVSTSTGADHA